MDENIAPLRIGFIEKYDLCKSHMLKSFITEWKKNRNAKIAYEKGISSLKSCIKRMGITNNKQILGLLGELIYFYKRFDKDELTPEMAIGYKSDFRGKILEKPSAIDVTINPRYKKFDDFIEIKGELQDGWDYYVGLVDLNKIDSDIHPLQLPVTADGEIGHFILILETINPSIHNLWGDCADTEYLIKFNPNCGGDEIDSVEEIVEIYNYTISKPKTIIDYIKGQYEIWPNMDDDVLKSIQDSIQQDINNYYNDLILEFKKLSGIIISAIALLDEYWYSKHDYDLITRQFWVHPHKYIQETIGKSGDIMDFNLASYSSEDYLQFMRYRR